MVHLHTIWRTLEERGYDAFQILVIDWEGAASSLEDFFGPPFPVLLDDSQAAVWQHYRAPKDAIYVLDANGFVRTAFLDPILDLQKQGTLLIDAIVAAME